MTPPAALHVENLTICHERRPAVHHLTGQFAPGSLTAIVGPNGAGKTTLLRALAGLHKPQQGRVQASSRIALLPQASSLDRSFPIGCLDAVMLGLWGQSGGFRGVSTAGRAQSERALEAVGLRGFQRRPVGSLSAGQFQRVLFARLLVQDAPVILLDEPFNALDSRTAQEMLDLVKTWHTEGRTVVAVLHDLDLVQRDFPDTLLLARHPIGWGRTADVLTAANRLRARQMAEGWAEEAANCTQEAAA